MSLGRLKRPRDDAWLEAASYRRRDLRYAR